MPSKTNTTINNHDYYRVTATVGHDSDGAPIRKAFYGTSKKEAEAKRDEYKDNIKNGLSVGYDKLTFGAALDAWFNDVLRPSVSLSSMKRYESDYRLRIHGCVLSSMRLIDIRAAHVQSFYNGLLEGYTVNTVHNAHKLMTNFFGYCVKADMVVKNPLLAVQLPSSRQVAASCGKALTPQAVDKLLAHAAQDTSAIIYAFAILTGLRRGELLALTHSDIDDDVIHVTKSITHMVVAGEYKAVLTPTKTATSVRDVPIMSTLKPLLATHIKAEKLKHLRIGVPCRADSVLFSSATCGYRDARNVLRGLQRLYKRLELAETTFHALRHTFCTILAEQGVPLKTASVLMGHSNISITAQIYTHVDEAEKRRAMEKMAARFNTI